MLKVGLRRDVQTMLFHRHGERHFGMDVATNLESSGIGKVNFNCLTGRLFARLKVHRWRLHIDLMEERIFICEQQSIARRDGNDGHLKGPILLDDGM